MWVTNWFHIYIYIFKLLNLILVPPMMTVPSQLEGVYIGGKNINVFWWQYVFFKNSVSWLSSLLNGISKNWTKSFHKFMTIYFWMSAGNISLRCKSEAFPASINYWVRGERLQTVTNSARYHILKHIKQDNRIAFFQGEDLQCCAGSCNSHEVRHNQEKWSKFFKFKKSQKSSALTLLVGKSDRKEGS